MPEEYDPLLTVSALNMLIVSFHRIASSGDMFVLDSEYKNVIDNLNFNTIKPDPELTGLCQEILKVIDSGKHRYEVRQTMTNTNTDSEKPKSTWELIRQISQTICSNALKSFSMDLSKWGEQFVVSLTSEHITKQKEAQKLKQNNVDSQLRLNQEELDEYSKLRNKIMETSWKLQHQYGLGDSYIIPQDCLALFTKSLTIAEPSDPQLLLEHLEHIEPAFLEYAPYWFYRAEASMEAEDYEKAEEYLEKFMTVRKPVLKRDPYMAEAMKYKIEILIHKGVNYGNIEEILSCLDEMIVHTSPNDWSNNIFAGMVYFSLGRKEEAVKYVRISWLINENEESSELLKRMETDDVPPRIEPLSDEDFVNLCKSGDVKRVEEALRFGANANAQKDSNTALICAACKGYTEIVELLLEHKANTNVKDSQGMTALMWATATLIGKPKIVELLLEYGADVNAKDDDSSTALIGATLRGDAEVAEVLLEHGADVNTKDNNGFTVLMWAKDSRIAELLLEHGAGINTKDDDGSTALMWATSRGNAEVVELILEHGADVNAKDNNGETALMWAVKESKREVVEALLKHNAKVNAKDNNGRTALVFAETNGRKRIASLLREHGAK